MVETYGLTLKHNHFSERLNHGRALKKNPLQSDYDVVVYKLAKFYDLEAKMFRLSVTLLVFISIYPFVSVFALEILL